MEQNPTESQSIETQATLASVAESVRCGELFRIWNGELSKETIEALEAQGVTVVRNTNAANPFSQYVLYNLVQGD